MPKRNMLLADPMMRRWPIIAIAAFVVLAAGLVLINIPSDSNASERSSDLDDAHLSQWISASIERDRLSWTQTVRGQVRADGAVAVGAEVSGKITEIFVDEGDEVSVDQHIASIDAEVYRARLRQIEAQLEAAEARFRSAALQLTDAQETLERREALASRGRVTEEDLQRRRTEVAVREANTTVARAEMEIQSALLDAARIDMERTRILSPVQGQVTLVNVAEGEAVNAVQSAPVLFEITRSDSEISVYAEVLEDVVSAISVDDRATVRAQSLGAQNLECSIKRIYRRPVRRGGFVYFGALVGCDDAPDALWAGMNVEVDLRLSGRASVFLVPAESFLFSPPNRFQVDRDNRAGFRPLWVINDRGEYIARTVQTGFTDGARVEVLSGDMEEGDLVFRRDG
jgi:HlyD family secretion protein